MENLEGVALVVVAVWVRLELSPEQAELDLDGVEGLGMHPRVARVAADEQRSSMDKTASAKREAADDKRDADYKVAVEKCDALAGAAKDSCVRDAKVRYGKTS